MKYVRITEDMPDLDAVIGIYESSFPEYERIPFDKMMNDRDCVFDAVYDDDDRLVGLTCVIVDGRLTFLFYLAVDGRYRSGGFGGHILNDICGTYREPILLNIELVDGSQEEHGMKARRRSFYLRHGFRDTGRILEDVQGSFNILCKGVYNENDYIGFLNTLGSDAYRIS